jgi:hypothetical protein
MFLRCSFHQAYEMMHDACVRLSASRNSETFQWLAIKPELAISTEIFSTTRKLSIQDAMRSA